MSSSLPWHAVVAMVVGYLVLAAWAVLLGGVVFVSLVGRWLAHRRVKRAVRDLVGVTPIRAGPPSVTPSARPSRL